MWGGWEAAGTSWNKRGSVQVKGRTLSSWGQHRNSLTSKLALLWAGGWTRDLLRSPSAQIILDLEYTQLISQRQSFLHQFCVMGSPCGDQQGFGLLQILQNLLSKWQPEYPGSATKNSPQYIAGNLQLQSTLVHSQESTLRATDLHETSAPKRCVCLIHMVWIVFWRCLISCWINIKGKKTVLGRTSLLSQACWSAKLSWWQKEIQYKVDWICPPRPRV